ncbi:hypothetical protein [Bacillus velezensis]|uniref:hypothetical protein n=1 Tax=Bacillus velezensis TaxID=492670 RepID=UPI0010FBD3C1|nr:hypothetical protein [Bacillus velezensis]QCT28777.1 hypothetical protein D1120_02415 [Bacillus velezensis]
MNINLLNRARLESDLESHGCLDIADELIEKLIELVFYYDVTERIIVQAFTHFSENLQAIFNLIENDDTNTEEKIVEYEGIIYKND